MGGEKDGYDRQDVIKYVAGLREAGKCQNTINTQLRPLKLLSEIQGWDFPKLSMKKVQSDDVERLIFSNDEVMKLIVDGKFKLKPIELSYLVLSTTYGLRREEIARLEREGLNGGDQIKVGTVKGGAVTVHLVPTEIKKYVSEFKPTRVDYMAVVFRRIMRKLGFDGRRGYGWHSIRRALATELVLRNVSILNIVRFMRWSDQLVRGELGMLAIYAKRDQAAIDKQVFKVHPFLRYWQ